MTIDSENDQSSYLTAYTDASYNEHTKIGGWAVVLIDPAGRSVIKRGTQNDGKYIEHGASGMEMFAILQALRFAGYGARLKVCTDNSVVANLLTDRQDDKSKLNGLRQSIQQVTDNLHVFLTIERIPRNSNVWMAYVDHVAGITLKSNRPMHFPRFRKLYESHQRKEDTPEESIV